MGEPTRRAIARCASSTTSGDYDGAVALALDEDGVAGRFAAPRPPIGDEQAERAADVATGFDDARDPLGVLRWVVLVAGLAAAATVLVGFGQRLREYR